MTSRSWPKQFRAAAGTFDRPALARLAAEYAAHLYTVPELPDSVGQVLLVLRQSRRYEELELVADAALAHGLDAPAVRRHYAQALVDSGNLAIALRLYTALADDEAAPRVDRIEARGGMGRCYKEMFLVCTEPDRRRRFLSRSFDVYLAAYLEDPGFYTWHGINAVALLARAARDGIQLSSGSPNVAVLAEDILRTVDSAPVRSTWTEVTACEAAIALGRYDEAVERGEAFIETRPEGFEVAAFLRQLQKVWQLDTASPLGHDLLPMLGSALLTVDGGGVTLASRDLRAAPLADDVATGRLERILGADRFVSLTWYRTGLKRCRAVARIQTADDLAVGTGFLVAGPDLHPDLPPLVVVTNGHVVPEDLDPGQAHVVFHGLDDDPGRQGRFRVARQWWYQPSAGTGLDTTILELDGYPADVVPTPLAKGLPPKPLGHRRAYVIGHPGGSAQPQFSLQDNILLDYDNRVLHYRSPTEGGSSGSPVSDDEWRLIGLHHAGGTGMPQLNGAGGTYAANEGITIDAIRRGLAHRPPE
ncbi:serine protease [Nocardioides sp. CER19]|uniref:trypsin-like serine peptidase n=1 Tax=Nocardioides sp. CER19 TaxID=3038538 RepID=UPI00244A689D|nr:serine protease [Nocardioides sp. CER19]MDH2414463.1 serine protease [Nocardioides sp. CER19]